MAVHSDTVHDQDEKEDESIEDVKGGELVVPQTQLEGLETVTKIYDSVRLMRRKADPAKDKQLESEFDQKLATLVAELKDSLNGSGCPTQLRSAMILKAKYALLDMSVAKTAEVAGNEDAKRIWETIRTEYSEIVLQLVGLILALRPAMEANVESLKTELESSQKETKEVLEAAQNLEQQMQTMMHEKERVRAEVDAEKKELQDQIHTLEEENKKYFEIILKHSKDASAAATVPKLMIATGKKLRDSSSLATGFDLSGRDAARRIVSTPLDQKSGIGQDVPSRRSGPHTSQSAGAEAAQGDHPGHLRAEGKVRREVRRKQVAARDHGAIHVHVPEPEVWAEEPDNRVGFCHHHGSKEIFVRGQRRGALRQDIEERVR